MKIGVYPGTFDPITIGHIDVIKRSLAVCDKLIVAVASDTPKQTLFSVEERAKLISDDLKSLLPNSEGKIEVSAFSGLLIDFAKNNNSTIIFRGLRAVSDFEYEFQLASMNSRLSPDLQTVFIPASENRQFIASNLVKEVARLGGDVTAFVTASTAEHLKKKFS